MNGKLEASARLAKELRQLKAEFSAYNNAHNMALGVLLMLNEERPAAPNVYYQAFLAELISTLCREAYLTSSALQEAAAKYEQKRGAKYFQYAALSYISRLGYKTGWDCPITVFSGRGFLSLLDELQRIQMCGLYTGKDEPYGAGSINPQERLGTPREYFSRIGEYGAY